MQTLFVERCMNQAPVKRDWPSENMPLNQRQVVSDKAVSEVITGSPCGTSRTLLLAKTARAETAVMSLSKGRLILRTYHD